MPNYVPGKGNPEADLMLVGEAPGKYEDEQLEPFVGPTGSMIDEFLSSSGVKRSEVYMTNVVKYRPPLNDFSQLHQIGVDVNEQIKRLWEEEIDRYKPKCILAIGNEALRALTGLDGILNYRGSILRSNGGHIKVVPTIHPAALFPKGPADPGLPYVYKKLIQSDFQRAVAQSKFRDFRLINRTLSIARNSLDVYRFFSEYSSLDLAANDIESINCIPVSTAFAFNKYHALSIPLIGSIGKFKLTDMSPREIIECWKIIQEQFERLRLIGQNYKYDEYKQTLFGFSGFNLRSDTLLKTHLLFPELPSKSLGVQASLWTEEPYYKDEGKEPKIGKFNVDQFFTYNGRDAAVNFEIDEEQEKDLIEFSDSLGLNLVDFYYNYIMRKHKFYLKMENNGWLVDTDKKKYLKDKYTTLEKAVHIKLTEEIGHEVNVKSPPQIYNLLYKEMRFPVRKREPTSEDTIIAILGNNCKGKNAAAQTTILTDILEERRIRDQKSRYINFEPDYDGRCKTSFKITGTETARTSTNVLKKPIRPKKIGLAFHTIAKHGRLGKDIRSMFIPDPGKVIISADLSQAEARIVAVLAQDWKLLEAFDTVDVHRRTAGLFFGFTKELILQVGYLKLVDDLEKDGPERFTGKMFRHAGNYDMGKRRAMNEFNVNAQKYEINMNISEWKAGEFIRLFHEASPRIRKVFHQGIRDAINSSRLLINTYGRPRIFNARMDDEIYKEAYAFIPQSTVADTTQSAAISCDDEFNDNKSVFFVSENHDSLTIQAPIGEWPKYAAVLKKHMLKEIDFNKYCTLKRDYKLIIPVDIEVSIDPSSGRITHYGDLHKASKLGVEI